MATPPPLTISGVESNQGCMRLVSCLPRPPHPSLFWHLIVTDEVGPLHLLHDYFHVKTTKLTGPSIVCAEERGIKGRETKKEKLINAFHAVPNR